MPWALLIRLLIRIAAGMFVWRRATARRRGAGPAVAGAQKPSRLGPMPSAEAIRDTAAAGWHLVAVAALLAASAVLVSAGTTLTVLSPRWLGITLLVCALLAAVTAGFEVRSLRRLLVRRRQERDAETLRRQLS